MVTMLSPRAFITTLLRISAVLVFAVGGISTASAETLLMPRRDGLLGEAMVVWGVTTLPLHTTAVPTTWKLTHGTTLIGQGNVTSTTIRSFINVNYVFPTAGSHTVTLEVKNGTAAPEIATVQVQIFDPANMAGPGAKTLPIGPGSNEIYRKLRINMAIQDGLRYLWTTQTNRINVFPGNPANEATNQTSWTSAPWWTAMVVTAFQNHGYRLNNDGSAPTGLYEKYIVKRGLNFVIGQLTQITIGTGATFGFLQAQPLNRDPCVGQGIERTPVANQPNAVTCIGLVENSTHAGYATGIAMMPLAASSALDRVHGALGPAIAQHKTYREILQRLSNSLSFGQVDLPAASRGSWSYNLNSDFFDGSTMGWAILGLLDADAVGITVPDWVVTDLSNIIPSAINNNGSFDYRVDAATSNNTTHMSKAGIPLQGLFMMGETSGANVDKVVTYIANRWTFNAPVAQNATNHNISDTYAAVCGGNFNRGCAYAMLNNFKGLKLQGIETLPSAAPATVFRAAGPGGIPANAWHADYEDWLVNNQIPGPTGGHWAGRAAGGGLPAIPDMFFSPQGTNDHAANAAIAELLLANVALVLPDADKFATVGLSADFTELVEGGTVILTAKAESTDGAPVAGATVNFTIIEGPNAGVFSGTDTTDADGLATFTYTDQGPAGTVGTDRIQANIGTLHSNIVEVVWVPPDQDGDGVNDDVDNCVDVPNFDQTDTDSDGQGDACDADDDGDGFGDVADNCPLVGNADQANNDGDSEGDACDADDDNDGDFDGADNCPLVANPDQTNTDGDAQGDACDVDDDDDGDLDDADNCPLVANPDQANTDGDSEGDACDADDDNDTVVDGTDNCAFVANPDQADTDADALGDACDEDDDGDAVVDAADNCQFVSNPGQANNDGDPLGDACDADDDNDTVADGADNCALVANADQTNNDGDASGDACDADDDNDTVEDANDNCAFAANTDQANNDGDPFGDACDADDDNDTVADGADNCALVANTDQANNDGDASGDACDADDDNDTVEDANDNCAFAANTDQANNDGDPLGDACDADDDNDRVADDADNCAFVANADQANNDGDASGDACDADDDNDTVADGADNCALVANTDQSNNDGDASGDACDADDDNDGVADGADNCQFVVNADQANNDGDAAGDICDPDDDNDTVLDGADNCHFAANTDQANNDGDGQGDACDADDDNDTVSDGGDNCPLIANTDQTDTDQDGTGNACDATPGLLTGRMNGGGSVFTAAGGRVTHGFALYCNPEDDPQRLQVNWGGNRFQLESVSHSWCGEAGGTDQPVTRFDDHNGSGTGRYNGQPGATVTWALTDAGEHGAKDTATITITMNGVVVLHVSGDVNNGNHQAHR